MRVSGTARCGQRPQLLPLGPCGTPFQPEAATGRSTPGWRVLTCILLALLCLARGPSEQRRLQRKEWPRARPAWGAGGRALSGHRRPAGVGQSCAEATPCCCRGRPGWAVPATGQAADAMAAPGGGPRGRRTGPGRGHGAPGSRGARVHFAGAVGRPVASRSRLRSPRPRGPQLRVLTVLPAGGRRRWRLPLLQSLVHADRGLKRALSSAGIWV